MPQPLPPAAGVLAKAVWVAPGAARSLGHGAPWGQLSIAAQLLYLLQRKDSRFSLQKVSPDSAERSRQGLSRAAADLTSTVSKSLACHFAIHTALIWIQWVVHPKKEQELLSSFSLQRI